MPTLPRRSRSRRAVHRAGLACAVALVSALVPLLGGGPVQADPIPANHRDPSAQCALPNPTGWTDEGHATDYTTQFQQPQGTKKAAMLFVDFPDAPAMDSTDDYYNFLAPAHGLMTQFSAGAVDLQITPVKHWLHMPQDSTTYGFVRGITWPQQALYVKQAGELAAQYIDLSKFDMVYIVPPKNATAITFSPAYVFDPKQPNLVVNGKEMRWGVTLGQDMYVWGPKVLVHETGHTFGLPDLYSFADQDVHHWVGGFDVMGNIIGDAPHHFGWEDWKIGWLADSQVACLNEPGTLSVRLKEVESLGGTKIAVVRTGPTTAYVAESRKPYGVDKGICKSGVVVYAVDSSIASGDGPIRVQNSSPDTQTTSACGEAVDWGAYEPGQTFEDDTAGVTIKVNASSSSGDVVTVTKS
ncbi:peptidase M6 [Catenulispora pinisilvae]|uniref:peptidase M6 n=1 Tax=Catenulispora pinisilvae TaxID=2705253 RepID=UPI0018926264|nr:peptidase M6 [Catenulispora pinisilvae]